MDAFNIAASIGSNDFAGKLVRLYQTLMQQAAFIDDEQFQILMRLKPVHRVSVLYPLLGQSLHTTDELVMPAALRHLVCTLHGMLAFAYTEALAIVLYEHSHYSVLLVDLVGKAAFHFDSYPMAGHRRIAALSAQKLAMLGVLPADTWDTPVAVYTEHMQQVTNCAIFVLLCLQQLDVELAALPLHAPVGDRRVAFQAAMRRASCDVTAAELRAEYVTRLHHATWLIDNAVLAQAPDIIDAVQVTGELCARASMRSFLLEGKPSAPLVCETLRHAIPGGMALGLHALDADSTGAVQDARVIDSIRKQPLVWVPVSSRRNGLEMSALLVNCPEDSQVRSVLFISDEVIGSSVRRCIDQLTAAVGAICYIVPSAVARGVVCGILPLMILSWWIRTNHDPKDDDGDQALPCLLATATRQACAAIATGHRSNSSRFVDWFFAQMLSVMLDDGHRTLAAVVASVASDRLQSAAMLEMISRMSGLEGMRIANASMVTSRIALNRVETTRLGEMVDAFMAMVPRYRPRLWQYTTDPEALIMLYVYALGNEEMRHVRDEFARIIAVARAAVATVPECVSSVCFTLAPVFGELMTSWPTLFIVSRPVAEGAVGIKLSDPTLMHAIELLVTGDEEGVTQLRFAPVAMFRRDHRTPAGETSALFVGYADVFIIHLIHESIDRAPLKIYLDTPRISLDNLNGHSEFGSLNTVDPRELEPNPAFSHLYERKPSFQVANNPRIMPRVPVVLFDRIDRRPEPGASDAAAAAAAASPR